MRTPQSHAPFGSIHLLLGMALFLCVLSTCTSGGLARASTGEQRPAACSAPTNGEQPAPLTPTTLTTIEQAYWCLFDHYVTGKTLDDRILLKGASSGLIQELLRRGIDQPSAMLPALTGNRQSDWQAFSTIYQQVRAALPQDASLQQALAAATMQAMMQSLNNDHTRWIRQAPFPESLRKQFPNGAAYGLGFTTSADSVGGTALPEAQSPLFLVSVDPVSPAALQGLQPGDIITTVNGITPFADDQFNPGLISWLDPAFPKDFQTPAPRVQVTLMRPSMGQHWTITLQAALYVPPPIVTARVLANSIAYVHMAGFLPNAATLVEQAIQGLHLGKSLHGIMLDLRSNGGGDPEGVAGLLGAFAHNRIWSYDIDQNGKRIANSTNDAVPCSINRSSCLPIADASQRVMPLPGRYETWGWERSLAPEPEERSQARQGCTCSMMEVPSLFPH